MPRAPVVRGQLRDGGAIELLRELERKRITGRLCFRSPQLTGAIALYGGEIAATQEPREDGRDPVDLLIGLGPGHYEVHQRLPALAVSKGDDFVKTGSLAVHVPADLMSYCEHAGLTGVLELRNEGRRAEAVYEAGELLAIELDGRGDVDLSEVFGWEQGRFRVELDLSAPDRVREDEAPTRKRAPKRERQDTRQFLRVVEMALVDVLEQSERARSPTRTSPPLPEGPKARPRPASMPARPKRRTEEHTVRLIYLTGDGAAAHEEDTSTRHVRKGQDAEMALTEAEPERRAPSPPESEAMAKKSDGRGANEAPPKKAASPIPEADEPEASTEPEASEIEASDGAAPDAAATASQAPAPPGARPAVVPGRPLVAFAWALGFIALALVILSVLARLPPVQ